MNKALKNPWIITLLGMVFAAFLILFYELAITAMTLQYSYFGVIATLIAIGLAYFAFPQPDRKPLFLFATYSLMASFGVSSVFGQPGIWRMIDYVVYVALAYVLGRYILHLRIRQVIGLLGAITLIGLWIPLEDMSVLSAYSLSFNKEMVKPAPLWPHLPAEVLSSNQGSQGTSTVLTLSQQLPKTVNTQAYLSDISRQQPGIGSAKASELLAQSLKFVAIQHGRHGFTVDPASAKILRLASPTDMGLSDFPFRTAHLITAPQGGIRLFETLTASPTQLLSLLLSPVSLPDRVSHLAAQSAHQTEGYWATITHSGTIKNHGLTLTNGVLRGTFNGNQVNFPTNGAVLLGEFPIMAKSPSPQAVVEGNNWLQLITLPPDPVRVVATLRGSYSHPLTSDILFASLTGHHTDALLVNTEPAQIIQLSPQGKWQRLWISNRSSFHFESVIPRSNGDLLIANAPSLISTSPIRYLGGYKYQNHQLVRVFRIYHSNLVNIRTMPTHSPGQPDLLTTEYDHPSVMILSPNPIPWVPIVYGLYGLLILAGLYRRRDIHGMRPRLNLGQGGKNRHEPV